MLSRRDALDLVVDVWDTHRRAETPRLDRIDQALRPPPGRFGPGAFFGGPGAWRYAGDWRPTVAIPDDAPPIMYDLARKAETNYLPLLVRVFRQALRVDGYLTSVPAERSPWRWWQANRMDARQSGLHDAALKYGVAYASVMPGDTGPAVRCYSPRRMVAVYADPDVDEWPMYAVHVDEAEQHFVLTDEEAEYRFGAEDAAAVTAGGAVPPPPLTRLTGTDAVTFIEARIHGTGHCPVVRYRDSMLLEGEEQLGIVEPMLTLQERINETSFGMLVAQYFAAFRQRMVIGWIPQSEQEEYRAGAGRIWYLDVDPDQVRVQELGETDLTRYIDAGKSARRDFAAIGQIPAGDLGVDAISNVSDATLAGLERAKNARAGEIALSLGEAHEQLLRLMAWTGGDAEAAGDAQSEVRWAEREARTWAGQIDGLIKLVQAEVLTADFAAGMVPGLTDQQVEEARADMRRARGTAEAAAVLAQAIQDSTAAG